MKMGKFATAIALSSCLGFTAGAQQPQQQQSQQPQQQLNTSGQTQNTNPGQTGAQHNNKKAHDETLAHWLIVENQAEIAIARMAEGKTRNEEVKKLASMLQKDHQSMVQQLQTFSPNTRGDLLQSNASASGQDGNRGTSTSGNPNERSSLKPAVPAIPSQNPTQANQPSTQQSGTVQSNSGLNQQGGSNTAGSQGDHSLNVKQIHQEIAQQCLSDAQAKLSKENGEKFDKCFVGMQVAMHAGMISKLTVFERHASPELKQVISAGKQSTQKHLEEAESLMNQLDKDSDGDRAAGRDSSTKPRDGTTTNRDK